MSKALTLQRTDAPVCLSGSSRLMLSGIHRDPQCQSPRPCGAHAGGCETTLYDLKASQRGFASSNKSIHVQRFFDSGSESEFVVKG